MDNQDRLTRWRLLLGGGDAEGTDINLVGDLKHMDEVLAELYDSNNAKKGGLGGSKPKVKRWLGDIRKYFPSSVVRVMQQDAYENLGLKEMLLEPEILDTMEKDISLVATILSLKDVIPSETKDTARQVVLEVVMELQKKLYQPLIQAVKGALDKSVRNHRPKLHEIDWDKTIRANLKHYMPEYKTVIPEKLIGYGRKGRGSLKDIILCIDQSGSMATSVVYASIFGAVMASMKAVKTHMVVFDTNVVDLTDNLSDPVDLLFGTQLGGGTDINKALKYCQGLITRPNDTIVVLITDLFEGGNEKALIERAKRIKASGVQLITLLALSDEGKPIYDQQVAQTFTNMEIPCFYCTPDLFPDLMAHAIEQKDLWKWGSDRGMV